MREMKAKIVVVEVLDEDGYVVRVKNDDGEETTDTVYVTVFYQDIIDQHYGADADGNRGVRSVERVVHESFMARRDKWRLTERQRRQVLADAEEMVLNGKD